MHTQILVKTKHLEDWRWKLQTGFNSPIGSFWFLSFYLFHVPPLFAPPLCLLTVLCSVPSRCPSRVTGLGRGLCSVNDPLPCWSLSSFILIILFINSIKYCNISHVFYYCFKLYLTTKTTDIKMNKTERYWDESIYSS
jgi:hypothetical protein